MAKMGDASRLKQLADRAGQQFPILRMSDKRSEVTVRFLTDPEDWDDREEAYDQTRRKGWPLQDGEVVDEGVRVSTRLYVNVIDREDGKVKVLILPVSLAQRLYAAYSRRGTMTDRDYTFEKLGTGLKTEYNFETGDKSPLTKSEKALELIDIDDLVEKMRAAVMGDDDEDKPSAAKRGGRVLAGKKSRARAEEDDEDEDEKDDDADEDDDDEDETFPDDEDDEEEPPAKAKSKTTKKAAAEKAPAKTTRRKPAPEPEDDEDEPEDDEEPEDEDDDGEEGYTKAELQAMTLDELKQLAKDSGWKVADLKGATKASLVRDLAS